MSYTFKWEWLAINMQRDMPLTCKEVCPVSKVVRIKEYLILTVDTIDYYAGV